MANTSRTRNARSQHAGQRLPGRTSEDMPPMHRLRVAARISWVSAVVLACGACAGAFPFGKRPVSAPSAPPAGRPTTTTRPAPTDGPRPTLPPVPPEPPDVEPNPQASDSAGVARLVRLAHLWHTIALHHPDVARRGVPWDSALIIAAPRVRAAQQVDTLARVYQRMMALLRDPATRLELSGSAALAGTTPTAVAVGAERIADSVQVLRIAPSASLDASDSVLVQNALERSPMRLLLDLRGAPVQDPATFARRLDGFFARSGLTDALVSGTVTAPAELTRQVGAWSPNVQADDELGFHDSWNQSSPRSYTGRGVGDRKIAILADSGTVLPGVLLALHDAGQASLVAHGALRDAAPVSRVRVPLADGLTAIVRTGELVHADGSVGVQPDTTIAVVASPTGDTGRDVALALLRSSASMPLSPRPIPWIATVARTPVFYDTTTYPFLGARLLAGFRLWSTMRARHAHRDLYEDDVDEVLARVIPLLESARTAHEYVKAVNEMAASLDDSEAVLRGPTYDAVVGAAALPFRVRIADGRAIVTDVVRDSVTAALNLHPGTEITAVDGYPLVAWLSERRRMLPASNEWSRQHLLAQYLSRGQVAAAMIKVRDANNRERTITVPRTVAYRAALPGVERPANASVRQLADGYMYVDVERLRADAIDREVRPALAARGVILDLRGVLSVHDSLILRRFATLPVASVGRLIQRTLTRPCSASIREAVALCPDVRESQPWVRTVDTSGSYSGRLVALIDERTQGAMERLALSLEQMTNVMFIGTSSAGSVSVTTPLSLPGGLSTGIATQELRKPDGGQVQRVGLTSGVEVRPTVRGLRSGEDEVMTRALQWLQQQLDPPVRRRR